MTKLADKRRLSNTIGSVDTVDENASLADLQMLVNQHSATIRDVKTALKGIEQFVDNLAASVAKTETSVGTVEREVRRGSDVSQSLQQTIRRFTDVQEQQSGGLEGRISHLESQFQKFSDFLQDEVETSIGIFVQRLERFEDERALLEQRVRDLQTTLENGFDSTDVVNSVVDSLKMETRAQIVSLYDEVRDRFTQEIHTASTKLKEEMEIMRQESSAQLVAKLQETTVEIQKELVARVAESRQLTADLRQITVEINKEVQKFRAFRKIIGCG